MLVQSLFEAAAQVPSDIAIIDDTGTKTWLQLALSAVGMASLVTSQTTRPKVGLMLPAGSGFVASFYGTLLAGKCVVAINFLLGEKEMAHVLRDSGIDLVLTIPQLAGRINVPEVRAIDLTALPKPADLSPEVAMGIVQQSRTRIPQHTADDMAVLMYTSGTVGLPKGVTLTFGNLQSDIDASIQMARLERQHTFLGIIPLFHIFGMVAMMLAPVQLRSRVTYLGRFSPVAALNAIRDQHISLLFGVPSMFTAIAKLKNATPDDFKSIYAMISGGEALPTPLRETFLQRFGVRIFEGYGLTETCAVSALNVPHAYRPGSVGQLIPGLTARIIADDGSDAPTGESGEIWLKGPSIARGYYNLPQETAAAFTPDGYFKTGDLGRLDSDGYLHITGRKKDLIIVAGEKAVPREIEDILLEHESVSEAAVVGKPDASRGEVVVAFVIPKEGYTASPDELREFCRSKGLMQWKIPREIFVRPDLPRSPTGKVLKRMLAQLM